jgi:hypothetical protein
MEPKGVSFGDKRLLSGGPVNFKKSGEAPESSRTLQASVERCRRADKQKRPPNGRPLND